MQTRIEELPKKTLVGKSVRMSLSDNKTSQLWKDFKTEKALVKNAIGTELYSIQLYDDLHYFKNFTTETKFTKWAAVEVVNLFNIPIGFSSLTIESGLYAVFLHKGSASEFPKTMHYIFSQWLPHSAYELDHRPHFELLGEQYKNNSLDSEEEVWIPIRKKA
ncbi:MAG: GyrI-like domain-containing protein [Maribacter sp.]|uniref:GyrI-like domain-containing protein n=1 Tax=Maribacter sp. TaxID=1897614 RepID=UPI003296EC1C